MMVFRFLQRIMDLIMDLMVILTAFDSEFGPSWWSFDGNRVALGHWMKPPGVRMKTAIQLQQF